MAAFVLATIADDHPKGQLACMHSSLLPVCVVSIQELLNQQPMAIDDQGLMQIEGVSASPSLLPSPSFAPSSEIWNA